MTAKKLNLSPKFFFLLVLASSNYCQELFVKNLPPTIQMHKDDVISFGLDNFLSGSQFSQQVFPEPLITTNSRDEVITDIFSPLVDQNQITRVFMTDRLTVFVVVNNNQLFLQKKSTNLEIRFIQKVIFDASKYPGMQIIDIKAQNEVYFVAAVLEKESSFDLAVFAFEFDQSQKAPSILAAQKNIEDFKDLKLLGESLTFSDFMPK